MCRHMAQLEVFGIEFSDFYKEAKLDMKSEGWKVTWV